MESSIENILLRFSKPEMISFMNSRPESFEEAAGLAVSDKQPFAWRAAWLLNICMKENDLRVRKYTGKIIKSFKQKKDGHQRELLKILLRMHIPEKDEGILFDACMNLWEQTDKAPSVRVTALKFIVKTARKYPELSQEITFLTRDHYLQTLSPGIKKSVLKMIESMNLQMLDCSY